jgi:AraC-like DNA-binding protein
MVEQVPFTVKDLSLLVIVVLLLVLLWVLLFRPNQQSLRPLYWCCLALFFLVGLFRMFASLMHWDIALDVAVTLVASNVLFVVGCVFFLQGPWLISTLSRATGTARGHMSGVAGFLKKINQQCFLTKTLRAEKTPSGTTQEESVVETQPQLAEKLTEFMEQQKPYLEPHITVERLAAKLNVSPKLLSGTINNELHVNFFELISNYRVIEAKKRLADAELREKPICEIMKSCGFNSKSVFNQAFKKAVGVTPSNYRQQHCQE